MAISDRSDDITTVPRESMKKATRQLRMNQQLWSGVEQLATVFHIVCGLGAWSLGVDIENIYIDRFPRPRVYL